MNSNFNVQLGVSRLNPHVFEPLNFSNNYISLAEARFNWKPTEVNNLLPAAEAFRVTYSLAAIGSGDTNGGQMLIKELISLTAHNNQVNNGKPFLTLRVHMFGQTRDLHVRRANLLSVTGHAKSANMDFVMRYVIMDGVA